MTQTSTSPSTVVPFPRVFAVLGYAIFSVIAVVAVVELFSYVVVTAHRHFYPPVSIRNVRPAFRNCRGVGDPGCVIRTFTDMTTASPVYDGQPWAEDFWREQRAAYVDGWQYEPFLLWSTRPFHGRYLNAETSPFGVLRRTSPPPQACAGKQVKQVWVFGGSSTFGIGDPDFATIPSQLSDVLNARGERCFAVTNFAVSGYNSNQELIVLLRQLQSHKPDVAVFYDGFNDAFVGAHSPGIAAGHMDQVDYANAINGTTPVFAPIIERSYSVALAAAIYRRIVPASGTRISTIGPDGKATSRAAAETDLPRLSRQTLDNYEKNATSIRALAQQYGFEVHLYWQPWLFSGTKPLDASEKAMAENPLVIDPTGEQFVQSISSVYAEAARRSRQTTSFTLLDHLFDSEKRPVFIDDIHTGPLGNRLIAERIAQDLSPGHGPSR